MKISNRTYYGLKLMLKLAVSYNEGIVSLSEIAEAENISEKFLENIVAAVKTKGILKVKRGAKGGYYLSKNPSEITLKEIFNALESDLVSNEWDKLREKTTADLVIKSFLQELNHEILNFVLNLTLEDLKNRYEKMKPDQMFYI
jgi:Rrf2 family transcriptional regulator, cysteine metabolism repressor